ncbi:MAG: rhodanese-like domain-containing protein, partial [Anaerolineales bacterium]
MTNEAISAKSPAFEIPESNKTALGLYVTPKEAYTMWEADPEGVNILDVRTFEEYTFVGHLEMAYNVPFVFPKYDPKGPSLPGRPPGCYGELNPDFIPSVQELYAPTDTILVYCATGGRGAMAVNMLAQAGFLNVYNIVTGLEGDR